MQYAGFATGRGFSDLLILLQLLTQNPNANIHAHLIDLIYDDQTDKIGEFLKDTHLNQFIQYLQYTFPCANIKISTHATIEKYLQHISDTNTPYADVISATDFMDGRGVLNKTHRPYIKFCLDTLQKNPLSNNLWLDRNDNEDGVRITTVSLKKLNNTSIAIGSSSKIFGYLTHENL